MHKLTDDWATKEMYRTGDDLKDELSASMQKLLFQKTLFSIHQRTTDTEDIQTMNETASR